MKTYKFLLKPAFFIFNLLFATWLVIKIEQLSPSDFGKNGDLFETGKGLPAGADKQLLKALFISYRNGQIDSVKFDKEIEEALKKIKGK